MDYTDMTDLEFRAVEAAVLVESARRDSIRQLEEQSKNIAENYLHAVGRGHGEVWVQPTGAHDAYPVGWTVTHEGASWESLTPSNVWEPGVSGWREEVAEGAAPAEWVAPTGAHDAYQKGDQVTLQGQTYESLIDSNTWSPLDYPAGWRSL